MLIKGGEIVGEMQRGKPTAVDESVSRGRAVLTLSPTMSIGYIRGKHLWIIIAKMDDNSAPYLQTNNTWNVNTTNMCLT
jgi:hypothetical protein